MKSVALNLRDAAVAMQRQIDEFNVTLFRGVPQTSHHTQTKINAHKISKVRRMVRLQRILFALADAFTNNTVPPTLKKIRNKSHVDVLYVDRRDFPRPKISTFSVRDLSDIASLYPSYSKVKSLFDDIEFEARLLTTNEVKLLRSFINSVKKNPPTLDAMRTIKIFGMDSFYFKLENIGRTIVTTFHLWELGITTYEQFKQARQDMLDLVPDNDDFWKKPRRKVQKSEYGLIGVDIDGYFPTPKEIAKKMVERAGLKPWMRVLEPSAGKGDLADAIKEDEPRVLLTIGEIARWLQDILIQKGYSISFSNFLEYTPRHFFDRIIMNPPFERLQDIDHVMHAYDILVDGGILISIMSTAPFFRADTKAVKFREWLNEVGGEVEDLPDEDFRLSDRPTPVATKLVIIEKSLDNRQEP